MVSRRAFALLIGAVLAFALAFTWWRLWRGIDVVDEGFSVLVPWRWALGDRPFVQEQDLVQAAGLLSYPFVKLYELVGGGDVTGLVLYTRHVYLGFAVLVAASAYIAARRLVRPGLAALVAAPYLTTVLFETPQLTANTLCAGLLTVGAALGSVTVIGGRRRYALAGGAAFGLACVAYPTVLFIVPFAAVFLAFALGRRAVAMVATGAFLHPPDPDGLPTGPAAWRAVSAWALGGALVIFPVGAAVFALAGAANLRRCWGFTLGMARQLDQLGGTTKAVEVAGGFFSFVAGQWYVMLAAAIALIVYRRLPTVGRWLLAGVPLAILVTGTTSSLHAAGAVIAYSLAAPYLYLFVDREHRQDGARMLLWCWAPAVLIGAMTAYTSADGFVHAAVGLFPGLLVSGLFLAWGLEPLRARSGGARRRPWPALGGLAAVVAVTLVFQVQFQQGGLAYNELTQRMHAGPWSGIAVSREQRARLDGFAADLDSQARKEDGLLVYPRGAGLYLYWPGAIAANTYQLVTLDPVGPLPKTTISYYRRHRVVPTLVFHLLDTRGMSAEVLQASCGGLDYPPVLVRTWYAVQRRPEGESTQEVLARLPRL